MSLSSRHLELANSVLSEVKSIQSRHDIISEFDLPFFYLDEEKTYIEKFGKEKIKEYLANLVTHESLREKATELVEQSFNPLLYSSQMMISIAVALSGHGDCGEKSFMTMAKLLEKNCPSEVNLVILRGKARDDDDFYNHAFIIIGNVNLKSDKLEDLFNKLNDDCLLVDPLLNMTCQANKALSNPVFSKYLKLYDLNSVDTVRGFTTEQMPLLRYIMTNAAQISEKLNKDVHLETADEEKSTMRFKR